MKEFFSQIQEELTAGRDICLATIINQIGSAPRSLGTRFLVRDDGQAIGTIGGGRLEAEVIELAGKAIKSREAAILPFRMRGEDMASSDMLCGGNVDVYLEPVWAADNLARDIFSGAAAATARGEKALLATMVAPGPAPGVQGRKALLFPQGPPVGSISAEVDLSLDLARLPSSPYLLASAAEGLPSLWLEPIFNQPVVYLFGGGHVSLHLAPLIKMAGFRLVVADDREAFANQNRFPQADRIWVRDFEKMLDGVELGPDSYVVIVTRGHIHDKVVLAQALAHKDAAYVGMIGSRRKRSIIYKALLEEGFTEDQLATVHSPIGLDIGAETPQEIGVSIIAELIKVRAQLKNPAQLKTLNV